MAIIGIDLGTTNSLAAVWREGKSILIPNALGGFLTPSVVSVDEDGVILVGESARERLVSHPARTASSFKRLMGTSQTQRLGDRTFTPEELSSLVLRKLKADAEAFLGEEVTEAVISVPAYFNDNQRCATKAAAQLAGLHTERLVNEPSAAALARRLMDSDTDQTFLVFDFGGGTLDVSVVECFDNVIEIVAVAGDNRLGGNDIDALVALRFCRENNLDFESMDPTRQASLLRQAELCKQALGARPKALMILDDSSLLLTNELLLELSAPLLKRMEQVVARALTDSGRALEEIDHLVLVGGSCKMPLVSSFLTHILGKTPVRLGSPDTVVAQGAGVYSGIKARDGDIQDVMMTDVCPFTLGIAVRSGENDPFTHMSPMIERNSILPSSKVGTYVTLHDNQKAIDVQIFQGESYYTADNLRLGKLSIDVPPAPKGEEGIDVRFSYDINGILEVEVEHKKTGAKKRAVIVGERNRMSQEEIDERLAVLSALKIHPLDKEENRLVLARGERLFAESLGSARRAVSSRLNALVEALSSQDERRIRRVRARVSRFFDHLEDRRDGSDWRTFDLPDDEDEDEYGEDELE